MQSTSSQGRGMNPQVCFNSLHWIVTAREIHFHLILIFKIVKKISIDLEVVSQIEIISKPLL